MSVLQNPEFAKYEYVVPCIAHRTKSHGSTEVTDPRTRAVRKSCEKYPSISCEVHEAFLSVPLQHSFTPASFICKPDGTSIVGPEDQKGWDRAVGTLTKKLEEVQRQLGRPFPRLLYDKAIREIEAADRAFEDGKFEKAVKALRKLEKDRKLPEALREGRVGERLAAFGAKGQELLDEAKAKRETAPDEALALAKKVRKEFVGLDCAEAASELVKEWEAAGE